MLLEAAAQEQTENGPGERRAAGLPDRTEGLLDPERMSSAGEAAFVLGFLLGCEAAVGVVEADGGGEAEAGSGPITGQLGEARAGDLAKPSVRLADDE